MINEDSVRLFCCDDLSNIENYDLAISDTTQTWHCHHRAEILPCGIFYIDDLQQNNLYFHRPANELIFLTPHDHKSIHGKNRKSSTKKSISEKATGLWLWYKNGRRVRSRDCPGEGWIRRDIKKIKNFQKKNSKLDV